MNQKESLGWEKSEKLQKTWAEKKNSMIKDEPCNCRGVNGAHKHCETCSIVLRGGETCNCLERKTYFMQKVCRSLTD
jgi:hypothetical protein